MAAYHNIPLRIARNRTLNLVSAAIQYLPVQDLPVYYNPNPVFGTRTKIYVIGVEEDVDYVLCNERGEKIGTTEIKGVQKNIDEVTIPDTFSIFPEEASEHPSLSYLTLPANERQNDVWPAEFINTWKRVVEFDSPEITGDRAYTILASRPNQQGYFLPTAINLRPDKQVLIGIEIQPADTLIIQNENTFEIIIDPGNSFSIILFKSLASIEYIVEKADVVNGAPTRGDGNDKKIEVKDTRDDVTYKIKGTVITPDNNEIETRKELTEPLKILKVGVRPDPAINWDFTFEPDVFGFPAILTLKIDPLPPGINYQLFFFPLPEPRFTFEGSDKEDAWLVTASGNPDQAFAGNQLHEDSVLFVQAEKPSVDKKGVWLTKRLFARVGPDSNIRMSVDPPFYSVNKDTTVQIRLHNTQKGVGYQLRQIGAAAPVPVMLTDAARLGRIGWEAHSRVFGMRIFSDKAAAKASGDSFRIQNSEPVLPNLIAVLPVPTGDISYEVEAVKEYTGLITLLTQRVSIRKGYLQLNGTPDRIIYKGVVAAQARTVEAWIRTTQAGPLLVWHAGTPGAKWLLHVNTVGELALDIQGAQLTGTTILNDGAWHHVCCVLDPPAAPDAATLNHVRLYVDGVPEQIAITGVAATPVNTGTARDLTVGNDGEAAFFKGDMAEIRVWETAIPETDMQHNRYLRLAGTEAGLALALYWKLNDGQGTAATDSAEQSRNGTLKGGMWK